MRVLVVFCFFSLSWLAAQPEARLSVEVNGIRKKGLLNVALFSKAEGFPMDSERALAQQQKLANQETLNFEFLDLVPGDYAVSVHHDEDAEGDFDSNFLGIPREGVGVSNNAKGSFGPPKFKDAKFELKSGENKNMQIKVTY